ncbi:MAG: EVE domain-containing protein [Verrucomicrobia bacterium]|nr:MAG: EVE domain-containing protein [Verrucomicrobiota bacterium]
MKKNSRSDKITLGSAASNGIPEKSITDLPRPFAAWLVKQEPSAYSWDSFVRENGTAWTGVRNFQARNYLGNMALGDEVLFYHSVVDKCIVGLARVRKTAYPDPTAKSGNWLCVDLEPLRAFIRPVSLEIIKAEPMLCDFPLVRQSRLSVMPVTESQLREILRLERLLTK